MGEKNCSGGRGKKMKFRSLRKKDDENAHFFRSRHLNKDILGKSVYVRINTGGIEKKEAFFLNDRNLAFFSYIRRKKNFEQAGGSKKGEGLALQ
jgi:hypothetical protein